METSPYHLFITVFIDYTLLYYQYYHSDHEHILTLPLNIISVCLYAS